MVLFFLVEFNSLITLGDALLRSQISDYVSTLQDFLLSLALATHLFTQRFNDPLFVDQHIPEQNMRECFVTGSLEGVMDL